METKFRRAKLSFWAAVRIGSHGMLQKPVRLLIVIFLTAVSLILFGLSVTAAMYDEERAIAESMALYDDATLIMKTDESAFTEDDLAALEERTGKAFAAFRRSSSPLLPDWMMFSAGDVSWSGNENAPKDLRRDPTGFVVLTEQVIEESGFSLLGRLPEGENEIAIPCCLAESFVQFNYYDNIASPQIWNEETYTWEYDEAYVTNISSHEEMLGKRLYLADPSMSGLTEATIVGVLEYECRFPERHTVSASGANVLEDQLIVSVDYARKAMKEGIGSYALAAPVRDGAEGRRVFDNCRGDGDFLLISDAQSDVAEYRETINKFTGAFVGVGVAFAVFAGALTFQFINLSIETKRGQVGILRALGARSFDVCRIFFSESFLLALLSVAAAIPSTVGLSYAVNKILYDLFFIRVAVLTFTVWMPVSIFLLGFVIAFVATVFPVLKEARKAPIDAIRDAA